MMRYENVCVEAVVCAVPEETVSTEELEQRLAPLYNRLRLPFGRLELMTGIKERRLWKAGVLPGDQSVRTVEKLFRQTSFDREKVGALIHASVCRDYQEPATACAVHQRLRLPQKSVVYDISNACLGVLTGMIQIANMIELGQIDAGIVVGTESSRALFETTIQRFNQDESLDRKQTKKAFASLTIGSGSAAVLLTHRKFSRTQNRLLGGVVQANTEQSHLCRSEIDVSAGGNGNGQLMWTDSETLLQEGVATAKIAFHRFCSEIGWTPESIDRTYCHQVGKAHQALLFRELGLQVDKNFATLPFLGNTGSCALPTAAAVGIAVDAASEKTVLPFSECNSNSDLNNNPNNKSNDHLNNNLNDQSENSPNSESASNQESKISASLNSSAKLKKSAESQENAEAKEYAKSKKTAFLGIGSGINVVMLAIDWKKTLFDDESADAFLASDPVFDQIRQLNANRI